MNGMGIFNSWPHRLSDSCDAMFDLLDNAVDAAASDHANGRISIEADDRSTGVVVINSCVAPVKHLHKVLELYTSKKRNTTATGENEIKHAQGADTLANVTFIISKNCAKYSLGIVADCLQTKNECWIPSFEFESQVGPDLEQELYSTLEGQFRLRQCVSLYGKSFLDGIRRLSKVMLHMDNSKMGWKQYPHVFCLLLHDLKHGENVAPEARVRKLLDQTKVDLPKHYLYIPKNLVITVESEVIAFNAKSNETSTLLPRKDVVLKKEKDATLCFTNPNPPDNSSVVFDVSVAPEAAAKSVKSEELVSTNDDHGISSTAPSSGQGAVKSNTKFIPRKRAKINVFGESTYEGLVARVGVLEDDLAQMKERAVTQENLENDIRKLRRHMARQDKVIAQLGLAHSQGSNL